MSYLKAGRDGLHCNRAVWVTVRMRIDASREGVAQRDGCCQHFDADQEVLIAGRDCTSGGRLTVDYDWRYYLGLL